MEKRIYTKEFKEEAVKLVEDQGISIKQAATELGISQSALRKWINAGQNKRDRVSPGSGNLSLEDRKVRDLEKRVRLAEMERDILKKAVAYFAKESL
jgi:transposase